MRRYLFALFLLLPLFASAQELTVQSFVAAENDLLARTQQRKDNNDISGAAIRVYLTVPGATFSGNVLGNVRSFTPIINSN